MFASNLKYDIICCDLKLSKNCFDTLKMRIFSLPLFSNGGWIKRLKSWLAGHGYFSESRRNLHFSVDNAKELLVRMVVPKHKESSCELCVSVYMCVCVSISSTG